MNARLEIWGGVECSYVRLPYGQVDQLELTGHDRRLDDLDRFAAIGLRTLRVPLLWERHATQPIDWSWADSHLQRLRELGIRPIVGLIHHGCGPLPGGFLDPHFVDGLAAFARAVAERYPWIDAYTPVNEPLTTARFSGTYGIWHPFRQDTPSFARILLQECRAVRAAMRAIRQVNPQAELVQTEDIGKTHSTPLLAYQADWENERRWTSFDLLCGRLTPDRVMYRFLHDAGIDRTELDSFLTDPCPPDLLGMNHYVTSERLLDEHLHHYPAEYHGGNGRDCYADVPAVRVRLEGACGPAALLSEVWERYHLPIAVTEAHLACTRDEQLRWLQEIWQSAQQLRAEGADVRAVTSWALLGAYDWNSLLVRQANHYENGAFSVRHGPPRPTAIADAIKRLAEHGEFYHPAVEAPGWWRRPVRLAYPPVSAPRTGPGTAVPENLHASKPLLILGADPGLAIIFRAACELRGLNALCAELGDRAAAARARASQSAWAVINLAHGPLLPAFPHLDGTAPRPHDAVHALLDRLIDRVRS